MKYHLKDVKNSRNSEKKSIDKMDIWVYFVVRPLSNIITLPFLALKVSANGATLFSTILGLIGALIVATSHTFAQTLVGLLFLNMWIIFDCVDGNIARTTKSSSRTGEFFDGISGYFFMVFEYISLGINVSSNYGPNLGSRWYMFCGMLAALATVLPRLIDQKSINMFGNSDTDVSNKRNYSLIFKVGLNIAGPAGLSNPLMIAALLLNSLNIYLAVYCVIQVGIAAYAICNTLRNVVKE